MQQHLAALAIITTILMSGAAAHELTHKDIKIVHPWVPETEEPQVALRVTLRNSGRKADRLLRASTSIASEVSIVGTKAKENSGIRIPARSELLLKSDGLQIMLKGLKKPLRAYDDFDLTLVFERAGSVKVDVIVEEAIAPDKGGGG